MMLKKMKRLPYYFLLFAYFFSFPSGAFAQTDSTQVGINLYGQTFFDNKEFTGNIKKGYTHPGFFLQPTFSVKANRYNIHAGFHALYLAGADTLERIVPVFSAAVQLSEKVTLIAGTLYSHHSHYLPEPLYKPERVFLNQPETGLQFLYSGERSKADLWINWERYIKIGSPFQEQFTVGFSHLYKDWETSDGFSNAIHALAMHKGGQIDSTNLPIQTLVNLGVSPVYRFNRSTRALVALATSFYFFANLSPSYETEYKVGFAAHPRLLIHRGSTTLEFGQWISDGFINPRGEELYGSLSTIGSEFNEQNRMLTTLSIEYQKHIAADFLVCANAKAYYDFKSGLLEYSYTLRLAYNGELIGWKKK